MSHRKSIPVQSLLYFNNFLEFPYFFRGYNFKYIYFYNQILIFFIYMFFVNIFGFSLNMLRIDYFKESIYIYLDFLNVSYFIKTGKIYRKKRYHLVYRCNFLLNIFKYSKGLVNKWLDRFIYMRFLFYKSGSFLTYKKILNCLCMYGKYSSIIFKLCKSKLKKLIVFENISFCIFLLLFLVLGGLLDFCSFLYWFYCFFVVLFSLISKKFFFFEATIVRYKSVYPIIISKRSNFIVDVNLLPNLTLYDFVNLYSTCYADLFTSSSFFLFYLKYFFVFLFYNFIFFNKFWKFCFWFFNYFKCICYCWPSIKLYTMFLKYSLYSKNYLLKNINYSKLYLNDFIILKFNSYILKKYQFFKYEFVYIFFNFNLFFRNFFFFKNYRFVNFKSCFKKYKALWRGFGFVTIRHATFGNMYRAVNREEFYILSMFAFFKLFRSFFYFHKLVRGDIYIRNFKGAYIRLCRECFFRRYKYFGCKFKNFFELNASSTSYYKMYSCRFLNKKIFYFILFFVSKIELIFQFLVNCGYKSLFFYYLCFFINNWSFLNKFFFKFLNANKKKVKKVYTLGFFNFFFFSKKFLMYLCRYFGKYFHNVLFYFSKKKLKYLYLFSNCGFFKYKWFKLDKLTLFDMVKYKRSSWKFIKKIYFKFLFENNIIFFGQICVSKNLLNKFLYLLKFYFNIDHSNVSYCNFGMLLVKLMNSIICSKLGYRIDNTVVYMQSLLLLSKFNFQCNYNFSELYVYSFLLEFNLCFLKGLSLLFCFFHFSFDFFFKFYINIYFMNFVFFCEFFYFIFNLKFLFNFFFLKLHLGDYSFCGFLGLYLLIFKFSKSYIQVTGIYILNYIFDIFYNLFVTNRYRKIRYLLRTLSNLFVDFLDLNKFCGFNFKIKGRMSKRTQRKQCFVVNRGVLKLTENTGYLFSGKRTLNTHIGSVSIYLYINLKVY